MDEKSKVTGFIKFDLDHPEGRDALLRAAKADLCYSAFEEIDNYFRQLERYQLDSDNTVINFDVHSADPVQVTPENHDVVYNLIYGLRRQVLKIIEDTGLDPNEEGPR